MMALSYRSVTPRRSALAHSILVLALLVAVGRAAPSDAAPTPAGVANPMPSAGPAAVDPARQAYSAPFTQSSTGSLNVSFGTVPAGKRLVIESESVLCSISGGAQILYAYMYTNFGRTYLLLQKIGRRQRF